MKKFQLASDIVLSVLAIGAAMFFPSWRFELFGFGAVFLVAAIMDVYSLGKEKGVEKTSGDIISEVDLSPGIYQVLGKVIFETSIIVII